MHGGDSGTAFLLSQDRHGRIHGHCFSQGCSADELLAALGLPAWPGTVAARRAAAGTTYYEYTDAEGGALYQVVRVDDGRGRKRITQRRPDPDRPGVWLSHISDLPDEKRHVPYQLPLVLSAVASGETIYIVEGEKNAQSAMRAGAVATCNAGGAGKWTKQHAAYLEGADAVVVQDRDDPGRRHAASVWRSLQGVAASVRIVQAAVAEEKADLSDHLEAGYTLADLEPVDDPADPPVDPPSAGAAPAGAISQDLWDDSHLSERVAASLRGAWLRAAEGGWLRWDGRLWVPEADERLLEAVRLWLRQEAARVTLMAGTLDGAGKIAARLLSRRAVSDIAVLVRGQLLASLADFDTDADIMVAGNGVVDLRTGELLPHDSSRLVMKGTDVDYRPGAAHPDVESALDALDDDEVASWLQVRLGQACTGYVPGDDLMLVLMGGGANGKSTLLGPVLTAMGSYSLLMPEKLLGGHPGQHSTEQMVLRGARLAVQEETSEGHQLNVTALKRVSGTAMITARHVHKDNVTFAATWGLVLSSNYRLGVAEVDHGTWRRLAEVPFPLTYVDPAARKGGVLGARERARDEGLRDRMLHGRQQLEAVLAWLVAGAQRWYEADRTMPRLPGAVVAATAEWRRDNDVLSAFADDRLEVTGDLSEGVWLTDLLSGFNDYLRQGGHKDWTVKTLRSRLASSLVPRLGLVLSERVRQAQLTVSRPVGSSSAAPLPVQGTYLRGVRWAGPVAVSAAPSPSATPPPAPAAPSSSFSVPEVPDEDAPGPIITDRPGVAS